MGVRQKIMAVTTAHASSAKKKGSPTSLYSTFLCCVQEVSRYLQDHIYAKRAQTRSTPKELAQFGCKLRNRRKGWMLNRCDSQPLLPHSRAEALGELAREIFVGGGQREQVIRKQRTPGGAAERTKGVRRSGGERGADATGRETERGRFLKITHKHPCKHEPNILIIQPVPFHSCCRIHSCVKKNE